jgi:hypothetical protein
MPQAADILSDPEINQAYEDVRSDKSDTTWLVLKVCSLYILPHLTANDNRMIFGDNVLTHMAVCISDF